MTVQNADDVLAARARLCTNLWRAEQVALNDQVTVWTGDLRTVLVALGGLPSPWPDNIWEEWNPLSIDGTVQ